MRGWENKGPMDSTRSARSAVARPLVVAAVAAAAILLGAPAAVAHAALVSTTPADGAQLGQEPRSVALEFNQTIGTPAYVVVTAPDGSHLQKGDPNVVDEKVTQSVSRSGTAGEYSISYRVVSADGHPVEGTTTYTVESGQDVAAKQSDAQSGDESQSFMERHRTHLLWGVGGIVIAAVLLFWPRRRHGG